MKPVFNWIKTGRKATYKLLQAGTSYFRNIKTQGLYILISDNCPCYTSQAFTSIMQVFSVNHITSSLDCPQSNGPAEKYIQIVKCLFKKAKEEGKDLYKCLMIYHNTPYRKLPVTYTVSNRQKC